MITDEELRAMRAREESSSGESWRLDHRDGQPIVVVQHAAGAPSLLRVTRDEGPASEADITFVAHARDDLRRLLAALSGATALPAALRREIAARTAAASPRPWQPFLESDGGVGGCNVISVGGSGEGYGFDEPDMYLWLDADLAPDPDFEFVAGARDDIPRLLAEVSPV